MNGLSLPWTEITIAVPLVGAVVVGFARDRDTASRWALGVSLVTLVCSILPWVARWRGVEADSGLPTLFTVDGLGAPLLPLLALLHALTILSTPHAEGSRSSFACLLASEALRLATFACSAPWPLAALLALGVLPLLPDLVQKRRPMRVYVLHLGLFVGLLFLGLALLETRTELASAILMLAVLVRSGTVPVHLWVGDLFEQVPFGSALLFMAPLSGVYAAVRLILPIAPDWVLQGIGLASLVTAVYAAGMAIVQRDARRFLAYLFLSHASLVLVGLELHTAVSLTGALCLWVSVALSLGGMGLTLRALEARFGRLSLTGYQGLYGQSPALAVCFLVTGLASVGFPGTLGFVAAELLADGAVEAAPFVGVGLVLAGTLNGIAILRAYLMLFTGRKRESSASLGITPAERFAVLTLAGLILGGGLMPNPGVVDRHAAAETLLRGRAERTAR